MNKAFPFGSIPKEMARQLTFGMFDLEQFSVHSSSFHVGVLTVGSRSQDGLRYSTRQNGDLR